MLKRIFDISFASFALVVSSPILLIVSVLIKLTSKGPVLFRQERVGKDGKLFKIYKFRTMVENAEKMGPKITAKDDPRITSLGRILRLLKVDELPQLLNVIKGDMSLVGPRPEVPHIVQLYTEEQRKVLSVRPGIVGPSQILGRNEMEKFPDDLEDIEKYYVEHILPEKLSMDLEYVEKARFLTDLRYLLKGIWATVAGSFKTRYFERGKRLALLLCTDLSLAWVSYMVAFGLRFDWRVPEVDQKVMVSMLPLVVAVRGIVFVLSGLYRSLWKYISVREFYSMVRACTISTFLMAALSLLLGFRSHPRSVFAIDWALLVLFMGGVRLLFRTASERKALQANSKACARKNALIFGAGDVGEMLLREIHKNPKLGQYNVVGFIDDDPKKLGMTIHGVKVLGRRYDLPRIASIFNVDEVLIAISDLSHEDMKAILSFCRKARVRHRMVPAVGSLLNGRVKLLELRDVEISDLLGRKPVKLNFSAIHNFIQGKRILVTGAGGSIGSELCLQIAEYSPETLVLVDRNENYLHEIHYKLSCRFPELKAHFCLCDITDERKIGRIFELHRPQLVFHAAAQKHVPFGEEHPDEAVKHNVFGTKVVAKLSDRLGAEEFVMISTDKAVNPTSVMGATKRVAELYVQAFSRVSNTKFVTVRFGNVVGSNGSVIPLFLDQIRRGGPITVTHPEVKRYFMSISEAVQLILQAVTMGKKGEIFILDMGEQIKILDLVKELCWLAGLEPGRDIEIKFIGLRPGEKLYEELQGEGEEPLPTYHERIKVLRSVRNDFGKIESQTEELCRMAEDMDVEGIIGKLREIVPEYTPWSRWNFVPTGFKGSSSGSEKPLKAI